jgi:hypothetical protein
MTDKKTVWITYAWSDNHNDDVDFIAQELERAGLKVKLDRWVIKAGQKLWPQIEEFIQSPDQCDSWLMVATQNSLGSEPCKEEYAYALDRALRTRGGDFPVMAVFPSTVDATLIPAGIRVRLHVSLADPDWKERIVSATEGRQAEIVRKHIAPYVKTIHILPMEIGGSGRRFAIEVRPRAGTWAPFVAGIPAAEKENVEPFLTHQPAGRPPTGSTMLFNVIKQHDRGLYLCSAGNEATPTMSYFLLCKELPSRLVFGVNNGPPQYDIDPRI